MAHFDELSSVEVAKETERMDQVELHIHNNENPVSIQNNLKCILCVQKQRFNNLE